MITQGNDRHDSIIMLDRVVYESSACNKKLEYNSRVS